MTTSDEHWFEPIAEHLGAAYLRYSFTKGTRQEVEHVVAALELKPGERVLDVGCGPGRHAHELARRGLLVHGVDISARFVELARANAPAGATFERLDARRLEFDREFDAAICLCQGAFGLMTADDEDEAVLAGIARALRPGGRLALTAFNAYFAVKHHHAATFDADLGVSHERTEVRDPDGRPREVDLWTGCYTPRELRLLVDRHGLLVDRISSVEPGAYGDAPPTTESPEFLVLARRPSSGRDLPQLSGRNAPRSGDGTDRAQIANSGEDGAVHSD
jgi:SAM-dependent methyltransferase